jgi:Aldehyde dehydrogenase family
LCRTSSSKKFTARTKTLLSGDPQDHKTVIGPLITPAAVKLVDDRVKEAVAKGAKLHTGGTFKGPYTGRPSSAMCRWIQLLRTKRPSGRSSSWKLPQHTRASRRSG